MSALAVALSWWAMLGAAPPACLHVQQAPLAPPVLGRGEIGGCQVWIARRLLPARTRAQGLRLCWAVIHELGHTIGLEHTRRGIMARLYVPGSEPGICWRVRLPATCIVCEHRPTRPQEDGMADSDKRSSSRASAEQQTVQELPPKHPNDTTVTVLEQPEAAVTPEGVLEAQVERAGRDVPDEEPPVARSASQRSSSD